MMLFALVTVGVGIASTLGGATGFGASLLMTPLLLLAGMSVPEVVVVNLTATLVSRVAVLYRSRRRVDRREVGLLALGSIPGAWLGAVTVGLIPPHLLKPAAGVVVALAGVQLALSTGSEPKRPSASVLAMTGFVGGYLSTSTSLNGPPTAVTLARARLPPESFVADLAGYFVVTNLLSLVILAARQQIPYPTLWPSLPFLLLAAVAGNQVGGWLAPRLPSRAFRVVVIVLIVASGVATAVSR